MNIADQLLTKYPIISDQVDIKELGALLRELEKLYVVAPLETLWSLAVMLVRLVCLFDDCWMLIILRASFTFTIRLRDCQKNPEDNSAAGDQFKAGELLAPRKTFVQNFKKAGLKSPIIHKGWFSDFTSDDVPENIMFAFFDGDFYESIVDSFGLVKVSLTKTR